MMLFILFNIVLFVSSLILTYKGFVYFNLFLKLPLSLQILVSLGFVTPIMNLKDTIKNFVTLSSISSGEE